MKHLPGRKALSVLDLAERLRQFASERDWDQFHTPKNLTMAPSVEVAEIIEHFDWLAGGNP